MGRYEYVHQNKCFSYANVIILKILNKAVVTYLTVFKTRESMEIDVVHGIKK